MKVLYIFVKAAEDFLLLKGDILHTPDDFGPKMSL